MHNFGSHHRTVYLKPSLMLLGNLVRVQEWESCLEIFIEVMVAATLSEAQCYQPKIAEALAFKQQDNSSQRLEQTNFEADSQLLSIAWKSKDRQQCTFIEHILVKQSGLSFTSNIRYKTLYLDQLTGLQQINLSYTIILLYINLFIL